MGLDIVRLARCLTAAIDYEFLRTVFSAFEPLSKTRTQFIIRNFVVLFLLTDIRSIDEGVNKS